MVMTGMRTVPTLLLLALVAACGNGGMVRTSIQLSSCSSADHDRYMVTGPDGKLYRTWHPAIDPEKGCSYDHDHGQDPRGSALYAAIGDIPFGVADEALSEWEPGHDIQEDHRGHKIAWANDVPLEQVVNGQREQIGVRCDFLVKLHQWSAGPSPSSLHELAYHVKCDDGTEIHATTLVPSGNPAVTLASVDQAHLAFYDPRFRMTRPAPCPASRSNGDRAYGVECGGEANFGALNGRGWGSAAGMGKAHRELQLNQTGVYNADGPTTWYTDPFGGNGRTTPFPGSIRQYIAAVDNDRGFALASVDLEQ
jgi:hypothetical protein